MNFDTWYDLYSHPYETREDAAERFADEQGYENPAEKQGFLDSLPEYDYGFGDWTPPEEAPAPTVSADYEDDPDVLDSLYRGVDLAQASAFGIGEGAGAGFLEDIGLSDASKSLKDWSREGRLRNEAEAATVGSTPTSFSHSICSRRSRNCCYRYFRFNAFKCWSCYGSW